MKKQQMILESKASADILDIGKCFKLVTTKIDPPAEGMLMQTKYISIDPIMRVWLSQAKTYLPQLKIGDTIHAFALSTPINNQNDYYFGTTGLQSHFVYDRNNKEQMLIRLPKTIINNCVEQKIPIYHLLTIILNGLPAYYGLVDFCKINKGKNVVISTAAGATGLFAIQLALHYQCNVIGITSTQKKMDLLQHQFPNLKVISYKTQDWQNELFKDGIDAYFDNVGDYMLDCILPKMKNFGRIALCGSMGSSSNYGQREGLKNFNQIVFKRLKLKGITFNQELNKIKLAFNTLFSLIINQDILIFIEKYQGLQSVPQALIQLYKGENVGKLIVELNESQLPKL